MKAILLPSLKSAKLILKKKLITRYIICTNNPAVEVYLRYKHNIYCININSYFSSQKRNFFLSRILSNYLNTLKNFDDKFNAILDLNLKQYVNNWIFHLYRYEPFFYYFALFNFKNSLQSFVTKNKIKDLIIYEDFKSSNFFFSEKDINKLIKYSLNINISFIKIKKNYFKLDFVIIKISLKKIAKNIIYYFKNIYFNILKYFTSKTKNILIFLPLYEVNIKNYKLKYNIYFKNISDRIFKIKLFKNKFTKSVSDVFKYNSKKNIEETIIIQKIRAHFLENFLYFLIKIKKFDKFIKKNNIKLGVWGLPPILPDEKVLMIKHLQNIKKKVIGTQHGGCYNDMSQDNLHALSDYHYCDEFHCYKKNTLDYDINIIKNLKKAKQFSVGSNRLKKSFKKGFYQNNIKHEELIIFPITNWYDNFSHFMGDSDFDILKRQEMILNILNKLKLKTIIKLIKDTSDEFNEINYPGYFLARYFKNNNFIVEKNKNLDESMRFYKPKLVILETISTPLYESVLYDCDIICFNSKFNKLKKNVENDLLKRAHIADSNSSLLELIKKYKVKKLKKKRNNFFLKKYLL